MSVQGLGSEILKKRCIGVGISSEPQEVFKAELVSDILWEKIGLANPDDFIAKSPEGIQAERFVSGSVRNDIRVRSVGIAHIVKHAVVLEGGYDSAGGDGAAGVTGERGVIV